MATHKGTVRITVPVSVGYNLKNFQKSLGALAERLGCKPCLSGADCIFQFERDYVINEKLAAAGGLAASEAADVPTATITLPAAVNGNLGLLQKAVANIADKLGCKPCTSGFDLIFRTELERARNVKFKLNEAGALG